ncbi:acyl-CoA dehydrogenase [Nakamurella sp. YIM 132087]|uniref:Acyl-CoA dehydrogenase n=1 Tax=Nakamurella alba TaxID=2665158 RepID=A0A7K1FPT6_9ACTN|nr:acyl-CoA dehydrogenase family protein [Nakamurella alba]MTD16141.1 acyl-CoA dehydrogenase [Nakamurella alba]
MTVERLLSGEDEVALLELVREICDRELAPRAAKAEEAGDFPREVMRILGAAGVLGLPYPEQWGGSGLDYQTYLQCLEEIAARWASVGVGVSVHVMSCYPIAAFGSAQQRETMLPEMLGGELLGAYSLSEAHAGSDPAAMRTRAVRLDDGSFELTGSKAWVTHGGEADFYTVFARLPEGISCFHIDGRTPGLSFGAPERKMGLTGSTTAALYLDAVRVPADRLIGAPGQGLAIALSALDSGRLGIAAVATGLAQSAVDAAVGWAKERTAFGAAIIDHQGLGFLLADMDAATVSARATYLDAARRRDAGMKFGKQASVAKLVATDNAMKVTTDAVQVYGGYGYTHDFPVERYMREAKIMQIFEGTNQIQRMVISRLLRR